MQGASVKGQGVFLGRGTEQLFFFSNISACKVNFVIMIKLLFSMEMEAGLRRPWLYCKETKINLEFLFWLQGSVIRPKIGYLIDGPVLLILERNEISVKAAKKGESTKEK